jgi:hypothetical protein
VKKNKTSISRRHNEIPGTFSATVNTYIHRHLQQKNAAKHQNFAIIPPFGEKFIKKLLTAQGIFLRRRPFFVIQTLSFDETS